MFSRQNPARIILFCFLAAVIGALATVVAKILLVGINIFTNIFYFQKFSLLASSPANNHLGAWAIVVPVVGGLIVGFMAHFGSKGIRGHGIPEAMEKILTNESRIQKRIAWLKPLSAAVAIGSGGPFGAEGPIIATGGAIGSIIGQYLSITPTERKVLLACGAAAGMTAIFGTPLAAVLLAIELLLFEYRALSFIPVAISSAVAASLHYMFFDNKPFFAIPNLHAPGLAHVGVFLISGVLFGLLGVIVTRIVYFVEDQFEKLPIPWMWWPALGGLAVGIIGIIEPRSLGVGYMNIDQALTIQLSLGAAASLLIWKGVSWSIALSSGTSGGTLAPLLTLGSSFGLILGFALNRYFPQLGTDPPILALVGMAAVFAASSRSLLASIVFAFEATGKPLSIVPLLCACSVAYLISHGLMKNSIMTEKIIRRGVHVPHEYFPTDPTA